MLHQYKYLRKGKNEKLIFLYGKKKFVFSVKKNTAKDVFFFFNPNVEPPLGNYKFVFTKGKANDFYAYSFSVIDTDGNLCWACYIPQKNAKHIRSVTVLRKKYL